MVNYQLGKIYKIICRITGEVYVGSTCEKTLARRLVAHRSACSRFLEKQQGSKFSSFQIIQRGDYYIELLENCPCNNNDELRKKEREWYDKIECINICRPLRFHDDLLEDSRRYREGRTPEQLQKYMEYMLKYREEHKEEHYKWYDKYYEENKEKVKEQAKKYREENNEHVKELKRANYHKNKKQPTEEEIEAKRLLQIEKTKYMRQILKEKREKIRRDNPNYEEEKKIRQRELHTINNRNYRRRIAEAKKQSVTVDTV